MRKQSHQSLTIELAGPGSGKTTSLISSVKGYCFKPDLRDVAVITYTNFACDRIEGGILQEGTNFDDQLFVGTIHSFLIRYVIAPFANKYNDDYPADLKYAEVKTEHIRDYRVKAAYISNLMKKGVIPYGKVESLARNLLDNKEVAKAVANKIQAIFVDEYQDATRTHQAIFEKLIRSGIDSFYCVGDSEQYIYGFTYRGTLRPSFDTIPINTFAGDNAFEKKFLKINWRSCGDIVRFLNNFVSEDSAQEPDPENGYSGEVCFIKSATLRDSLDTVLSTRGDDNSVLVLAYAASTLELTELSSIPVGAREAFGCHKNITSIVGEFITNLLKMNRQSIVDKEGIDEFELRGKIISFADYVESNQDANNSQIIEFVRELLPLSCKDNLAIDHSTPDDFLYVKYAILSRGNIQKPTTKMTIHKAKGLEADIVLAIAATNNELSKWLETDKKVRSADSNDTCRIGFVAFSRAKKKLYITCKESLSLENEQKLKDLGVHIQ